MIAYDLDKPLWQLTVGEFLELASKATQSVVDTTSIKEDKKYVYGIAGIAQLFNCSMSTANRIKQSGKINRARVIIKSSKKIK